MFSRHVLIHALHPDGDVVACFRVARNGSITLTDALRLRANTAGESAKEGSQAKSKRGALSTLLPGAHTLTQRIELGGESDETRAAAVQFEITQRVPQPAEALAWDAREVRHGEPSSEMLAVITRTDAVERQCQPLRQAGWRTDHVLVATEALAAAFRHQYPDESATLLIVMGGETADFVWIDGDDHYARTIRIGSDGENAFGHDADTAGLPPQWSEKMVDEAERTWAFANRHKDQSPCPWRVLGASELAAMLIAECARHGRRAEVYDPTRRLTVSPHERSGAIPPDLQASLLGGVVLLRRREFFDLLPKRLRVRRDSRQRQPWWIASAALLVLAPALWLWRLESSLREIQAQVTKANALLVPLRECRESNARDLAALEKLTTRRDALGALQRSRTFWRDFLADFEGRLHTVGDVWLEKLTLLPPEATKEKTTIPFAGALRFAVTGCLIDRDHAFATAGDFAYGKVNDVLAQMDSSPFVEAVDASRFDTTQPGMLRFEFTVTLARGALL